MNVKDIPDFWEKVSMGKMLTFHALLRYGSAAHAAHVLGIPNIKIHNDVNSLEKSLGAPLLHRNSKKLVLTELGEKVANLARTVTEELEAFIPVDEVERNVKDLIIGSYFGFASRALPKILEEFYKIYPHIRVVVHLGKDYLDFTTHDCDVVYGEILTNRSDLTHYMLDRMSFGLYASKEYLKKYGTPAKIGDLKNHRLLVNKYVLFSTPEILEKGQVVFETTSERPLVEMALLGLGIATLTAGDKTSDAYALANKYNLVRVLPNYSVGSEALGFMAKKFNSKSKVIDTLLKITQKFNMQVCEK